MFRPTVEGADVRRVLAEVRALDENAIKELRKDLRTGLMPFASSIASSIPNRAPMSGMVSGGRTAWPESFRASIFLTPGRSRRGGVSKLLGIRVRGYPNDAGLTISELAGSRSSGYSASGRQMISVLRQRFPSRRRGGRFVFDKFLRGRKDVERAALRILDDFTAKVNKRLERN